MELIKSIVNGELTTAQEFLLTASNEGNNMATVAGQTIIVMGAAVVDTGEGGENSRIYRVLSDEGECYVTRSKSFGAQLDGAIDFATSKQKKLARLAVHTKTGKSGHSYLVCTPEFE